MGNNEKNATLVVIPSASSLGIAIRLLPGDFIIDNEEGNFGGEGEFFLKITNTGSAVDAFRFHVDMGLLEGWEYWFHENGFPSKVFQIKTFDHQFPEVIVLRIRLNESAPNGGYMYGNSTMTVTASSVIHPEVNDSVSFFVNIRLKEPENEDSSPLPAPPSPLSGVVLISAGLVGFAAVLAYSEPSRYRFFAFLIPLYTRLKKDDLETLQNRKEILGFIKGRPGANYSTIMHALEIGNGTLTYHLNVLEENRVIKSRVEANRKLFYPQKYQITKKRERILELLEGSPGLNQRDIVRVLRMSRRKAGRKLNELVDTGMIRIEKKGRENHYYLVTTKPGDQGSEVGKPRAITGEDT